MADFLNASNRHELKVNNDLSPSIGHFLNLSLFVSLCVTCGETHLVLKLFTAKAIGERIRSN